jgi:hypothetical protein
MMKTMMTAEEREQERGQEQGQERGQAPTVCEDEQEEEEEEEEWPAVQAQGAAQLQEPRQEGEEGRRMKPGEGAGSPEG